MSTTVEQQPDVRYEKVRADFYASIGLKGKSGPLTEKASKQLDKLIKQSDKDYDKAIKAEHKEDVPEAKAKVLYLDRRERLEAKIISLQDYLPVSQPLIGNFDAAKLKADNILKADGAAWAKANEALHDESVKNALTKADEFWNERENKAREGKKSGAVYTQIDLVRKSVADARPLLTDPAMAAFETKVMVVERAFLASDLGTGAIKKATDQLGVVQLELGTAAKAANGKAAEARAARKTAEAELAKLDVADKIGPLTTEAERAVLLRGLRGADTALATREFTLAKSQLDALVLRAQALSGANTTDRGDWAAGAGKMKPLHDEAAKLAGSAASPEVRADAAALVSRLDEVAELGPGKNISYRDALGRLTGGRTQLDALIVREDGFKKFAGERVKAAARIEKAEAGVDVAFTYLRAAVLAATRGKQNDIADGEFNTRLAQAKDAWAKRLETAYDVPTLDEAKAAADLKAIAQAIRTAAADPTTVAKQIAAGELDKARKPYDEARAQAAGKVKALLAVDAVKGAEFMSQLRQQDAAVAKLASPGGYGAARAEVIRIGAEAVDLTGKRSDLIFGLQTRLDQLLAPMTDQLADLFSVADGLKNEEKSKSTRELQQTLQTGYDELRALGKAGQVPLLNQAIDDAGTVAKDLAAALAAAKGKELPGGEAPYTFSDARKQLADVKANLADTKLQTYCLVSATELSETIGALEKAPGARPPSALQKEVEAIVTKTGELKKHAVKAKADCDTFKAELDKVEERLKTSPLKDAKAYADSLKSEIKGIYSNACFEGGLDEAKKSRDALVKRLDEMVGSYTYGNSLPVKLANAEEAKAAETRKNAVAKAKFDGEVEVLEKRIKALKTYSDDKDGLETSLKEIKDTAKKSADFEALRDQLQGVRDRLALLAANPRGLAIHVRKQLPGVNRRWRTAVSGFGGGLDGLIKTIDGLPDTDLDAAGKKAVRDAIGAVRVLFNPAVFERPLSTVANEGVKDNERSAAREAALRDLRRMIAYLVKDYRIQELASCPFAKEMGGLVSELNLSLLDIENNVLVSM